MAGVVRRLASALRKFSEGSAAKNIVKEGYKIVLANGGDEDRVLELMRKTFFKDEPSMLGLGMKLENVSDSLQRFVVGDLSEGKALLAVDKGDRLLGLCLGKELTPGHSQHLRDLAGKIGDQRAKQLLRFWAHMYDVAGLPESVGADRAWEFDVLATDPIARGLGIAKELTVASREEARKAGYPWVCMFCTSEFSAKLCRSLGLRHHLDFPYNDYRDQSGRQLVTPPPPHTKVSFYVEQLDVGGGDDCDPDVPTVIGACYE